MSLTSALPKFQSDLARIVAELESGQGGMLLSSRVPELCSIILEFLLQAQVTPGQVVTVSPGIAVATTGAMGPSGGATTAPGTGTVTSPGTLL